MNQKSKKNDEIKKSEKENTVYFFINDFTLAGKHFLM